MPVVQAFEGCPNSGTLYDTIVRKLNPECRIPEFCHRPPAPAAYGAALICHNCQEPWFEVTTSTKVGPLAPSLKAGVLDCVLRVIAIVEHAKGQPICRRDQRSKRLFKPLVFDFGNG